MAPVRSSSKFQLLTSKFAADIKAAIIQATRVSLSLFRIMIPIIVGVKLLQELGIITYVAMPLSPLMGLMGLPGEMGLVWATAMINNIYGGMIVFVSLYPDCSLTTAQVTILGTMILIAHSMPIELEIARKSGNRFTFQCLMRIGSAIIVGILLYHLYELSGWLQSPNHLLWSPEPKPAGLFHWGLEQLQNLAMIMIVIFALVTLMRILDALRVTQFLTKCLGPFLRILGIGPAAAPLAIIGMVMGLAYGGGLIIHEAQSGKIQDQDIFFSVSFMGLAHSIFEDTLLMVLLGGHLSGLLWIRVLYATGFTFLLVRLVRKMPQRSFYQFFFKSRTTEKMPLYSNR